MKRSFFCFVCAVVLSVMLAACSQDSDALESVRVSGEMRTVFQTGSNGHLQQNRLRTGIEF